MKNNSKKSLFQLIASMALFGTIGLFRRAIPLSSGVIAMARGYIGGAFLMLFLLVTKKRPDWKAVRANLPLLCLSGAAIGFNWILLFEAYNYTSVAIATLCYYMAPIFLLFLSPVLLHEKLTRRKLICLLAALLGMVFVSGVLETGISSTRELRGILLGLGAALLYASVILMNKKMSPISAYDKTAVQLLSAGIVMHLSCAVSGSLTGIAPDGKTLILLLIVCILHTGIGYTAYFGSMDGLSSQTLALFSYIDPVVAVLLSALLLHEPMSLLSAAGAVLVLASALISELPERKKAQF